MTHYDVIIIGGGAAGFFAAINMAAMNPKLNILVLERGKEGLQKVRISGGGRCNVTHAEFMPSQLVENYPRGHKELLGPFHQFMTADTIEWFDQRGVELKIEDDGRMFPTTDSSKTIVDCFLNEAEHYKIKIFYKQLVTNIELNDELWQVRTKSDLFYGKKLLIATGSNTKIWELLSKLGHSIVTPVPSLFTFDISDERIKDIPGLVVPNVQVQVLESNLSSEGPLLITHVGLSAPAILKLSAYGALEFAKLHYNFKIEINFICLDFEDCLKALKELKSDLARKTVHASPQFDLPKRLWRNLISAAHILPEQRWADINKSQLENLTVQLTAAVFQVEGKSTFKEEFVTAGGVDLKEINFKTFESKVCKSLFLAGEVLNIDAVTGGFNFQNAWTGAYIAAKSIAN